MSDLNERVNDVMEQIEDCISPNNMGAVKHRIRKALQEQDKITREACCTLIGNLPTSSETGGCLEAQDTQDAIMNYQGGTK